MLPEEVIIFMSNHPILFAVLNIVCSAIIAGILMWIWG